MIAEWQGQGIVILTVHGISLAVVPARIAADEELKVVVAVLDGADLIILIDEVTGWVFSG